MARTDNLGNFLTDVATAIKNKTGASGTILAYNFDTEINNISTGGPISQPKKDVNFYDFDGTRLYSYTKTEFLALEQLPANPSHTGLTAQGWNWSLASAKSYVTTYGELAIGQMYITSDGATKLHISITDDSRLEIPICFTQSATNGIEVDWGDGSTPETFSSASSSSPVTPTHQYATKGDYVISLKSIVNNCTLMLGANDSSYCVMGKYATSVDGGRYFASLLKRVDIGNNLTIFRTYAFRFCTGLKYVTMPSTVTAISSYAFGDCCALQILILPSGMTQLSSNAFSECRSLETLVISSAMATIQSDTFYNTYSLQEMYLPEQMTSLSQRLFYYAYAISKLIVPKTVTYIYSTAFGYCNSLKVVDFSNHTAVPTLASYQAFTTCATDYVIVVPDALYETWKTTSQWSQIASHIVSVSNYSS